MSAAADTQFSLETARPFAEALKDAQTRITAHMEARLAGGDELHAAMRYAITGGKMLRGFLVLESARLHGVAAEAGT